MMMLARPVCRSLGLVGALLTIVIACEQSQAAPDPSAGERPTEGRVEGGKQQVEDANYVAKIEATGDIKAGKEATAIVTLEPKGVYKINDKYPMKLKLKDSDGVTYAKAVLRKEDGEFSDKKGTFKVAFTPKAAGKATVGGKLSMSVCSDENCIMQKVDLAVEVDVK